MQLDIQTLQSILISIRIQLTFYVNRKDSSFFNKKILVEDGIFIQFYHQTHCKMLDLWLISECTERTVRAKQAYEGGGKKLWKEYCKL